eukprot:TRINITY_DN674_c0_g1_i12.p3 TRINITY_DN674_c0_g1~~TRINITY_DN674_c0_g1_i12.p3  ORF type:complete len:145 (+),score=28.53 TRINITY_DN674_c0_g1_i12:138-572(+)
MKGLIIFAMIVALGLSGWKDCARSTNQAECKSRRGNAGPCLWSGKCFDPTVSWSRACQESSPSECGRLVSGCTLVGGQCRSSGRLEELEQLESALEALELKVTDAAYWNRVGYKSKEEEDNELLVTDAAYWNRVGYNEQRGRGQ